MVVAVPWVVGEMVVQLDQVLVVGPVQLTSVLLQEELQTGIAALLLQLVGQEGFLAGFSSVSRTGHLLKAPTSLNNLLT